MELEFRNVHIDMLALPMDIKNSPFSRAEAKLAEEFDREYAVTKGVVLALKKKAGMRYDVAFGFDVIRAANKAGIEYIPCLIGEEFSSLFIDLLRTAPSEQEYPQSPEDAIQRAMETFNQLKGLKLSFRKAEKMGKLGKKSTLYDEKRLAKNLDQRVQLLVKKGKLAKSAARSISYMPLDEQHEFALTAIQNGWSVREINLARSKNRDSPVDQSMQSDLDSLASELSMAIGYSVSIVPKTRLSGTLQINYFGFDALASLLERLSNIAVEFTYNMTGVHDNASRMATPSLLIIHYKDLNLVDEIRRVFIGVGRSE